MNLSKLNPWNWFKHEEAGSQIPVKRPASESNLPVTGQSTVYPVQQLHQQIDRLFDEAFRSFGFPSLRSAFEPPAWLSQTSFRPNLNVSSDDKNYHITIETPGMCQSDLSIEVSGDVLTIQGQKQEEKENKDRHFYRIERSYGSFQRTLALPDDADPDAINAVLKDGVLELAIPRKRIPERESKKITIQ
jgi:HSP20 family protein